MFYIRLGRFSRCYPFLAIFLCFCYFHNWTTGERIRLSTLRYDFDPKYFNMTAGLDSKGVFNVDYQLLQRFDTLYVHFKSYTDEKNVKILTDRTLDLCRVFKLNAAAPLFLSIIQMVKKTSNIPFECPTHPGRYYIRGLDLKVLTVPSGRLLGISNNIKIETTFMRDKAKDEVANSDNGKMLFAKFWSDLTLIR